MRILVLVTACVGLLVACGKPEKTVVMSGNGGTVTMSQNGAQITATDSKTNEKVEFNAGGGGTPANLPSYVSVYPGAKVTASVVGSGGQGGQNGGMIAMQTTASADAVIAYYRQKSAAAGFVQKANMTMGTMMMFTASTAGDKESIQVSASPQSGMTNAQVIWGQK